MERRWDIITQANHNTRGSCWVIMGLVICLLIVKLAVIQLGAENAKGFQWDHVTMTFSLPHRKCHLPDDLCCIAISLHFLGALVLVHCCVSLILTTPIMPPKPKPTSTCKRNKGTNNAPKRLSKTARNDQASAAIQHDLDTEEEYTGDEVMIDPLQGMANRLWTI